MLVISTSKHTDILEIFFQLRVKIIWSHDDFNHRNSDFALCTVHPWETLWFGLQNLNTKMKHISAQKLDWKKTPQMLRSTYGEWWYQIWTCQTGSSCFSVFFYPHPEHLQTSWNLAVFVVLKNLYTTNFLMLPTLPYYVPLFDQKTFRKKTSGCSKEAHSCSFHWM